MDTRHTRAGFSLIEVAVVGAIIGAIAAVGTSLMADAMAEQRAKAAVREVADLLTLARTEAIRTGTNHIVFFAADAEDVVLTGPNGSAAAGLLIRDDNGDGKVDAGEKVTAIQVDDTGSLEWGSALAANLALPEKAPEDNTGAIFPEPNPGFLCCTFQEPDGDPARWVMFTPDGTPRNFSIIPFTPGPLASGNGGVYVTSTSRDYAVVVAPLGGVRVHAWNDGSEEWTK